MIVLNPDEEFKMFKVPFLFLTLYLLARFDVTTPPNTGELMKRMTTDLDNDKAKPDELAQWVLTMLS